MSIQKLIKKVCVQTAVYWGNPHSNGIRDVFDAPVELSPNDENGVRWDDVEQIDQRYGEQVFKSKASVLVCQDLDVGGWLYLGTLASLSGETDPRKVDGAYIIGEVSKSPEFKSTTKFVRIVKVGWQNQVT